MDTPTTIFNWQALVIGSAALLLCLLMQGSTVVLVMTKFKPRIRVLAKGRRSFMAHVLFLGSILILLMSHLAQIYIWALFLYAPDIMSNIHRAVLFAGSTYTTVGFSNDNLPLQWQLLAVIMATTGLFAFAWSTSIMYALSQQLYPSED